MATHVPLKVPEHFSRVDIGAYMRELRLHYALSEQDVSERLHIRTKYVTAIETAQFDLMPGKAYARGYVHTYAEFLGLDADQIVERCFGGEMAREVQPHSIPSSSDWYKRNKRYGGVLAVFLLLGALLYFATKHRDAADVTASDVARVEQVPEEYLASQRNRLMPTADNFDCLANDDALMGCYMSQQLTKRWVVPPALSDMSPAASEAEAIPGEDEPEDNLPENDVVEKKPATSEVKAVPTKKPAPAKPVEAPVKKTGLPFAIQAAPADKPAAAKAPAEAEKEALKEKPEAVEKPTAPEPPAPSQKPASAEGDE